MNELAPGHTAIDQPEPVHDYGLTAADRVMAASVLSDIEILEMHGNAVPGEWATNTINFARAIESAVLARQSVPDDFVAQLQALEKEALAIIAAGSVAQSVPDDVARDAARYRWLRDIGDTTWEPMAKRVGCTPEMIDRAIDEAITKTAPLPPKEQP